MAETMTPEQVANEMWDHLSYIDWRYEGPAGLATPTLHASTVIRWCEAMGWEWPEGMARAIRSDKREKLRDKHQVHRLPSGKYAIFVGDEPLRDKAKRTRTWGSQDSADDYIDKLVEKGL
jgi:hypothetical protein